MNKKEVLQEYLEYLDKKIGEMQKALDSIYRGIDTAPTPSESHSDTTRSQQSRVALETSGRLSSLKSTRAAAAMILSVKLASPVAGALIAVEDAVFKDTEYYFVVPGQGGESVFLGETEILFVSVQAPILEAISQIKEGDDFEFRGRKLRLASIS